jgi:hypothetical protein
MNQLTKTGKVNLIECMDRICISAYKPTYNNCIDSVITCPNELLKENNTLVGYDILDYMTLSGKSEIYTFKNKDVEKIDQFKGCRWITLHYMEKGTYFNFKGRRYYLKDFTRCDSPWGSHIEGVDALQNNDYYNPIAIKLNDTGEAVKAAYYKLEVKQCIQDQ